MVDRAVTTVEINRAIMKQGQKSGAVKIGGLTGQDAVAVGIERELELMVIGEAGAFLGALNEKAVITMEGSGGNYLGDNMRGGGIIVNGNVGDGAGAYLSGGIIVVRGDAGNATGIANRGGTIIVKGDAGDDAGLLGCGGIIILCGNVKRRIGHLINGGAIYIGGKADSLGENVIILRLTDEEREMLKTYFVHYGMDTDPGEFKKIAPRDEHPLPTVRIKDHIIAPVDMSGIFLPPAVIYSPGPMNLNYDIDANSLGLCIGGNAVEKPLRSRLPALLRLPRTDPTFPGFIEDIARAAQRYPIPCILGPLITGVREDHDLGDHTGHIISWSPDRMDISSPALKASSGVVLDMTSGILSPEGAIYLTSGHVESERMAGVKVPTPYRHADMASIKELRKHIALLREVTDHRVPIILRMEMGHPAEDIRLAKKVGPDAVILYQAPKGGAGVQYPFLGVFPNIRRDRKEKNEPMDVPVGVELPSTNGWEIVKCLALGADFVVLDPAILMACEECSPCKDRRTCEQLTPDGSGGYEENRERYVRRLNRVLDELDRNCREVMTSLSISNLKELTPENLYALDYNTASVAGIKLAGYHRRLPMWSH